MEVILNKQFEIGGYAGTFKDIPEDGMVQVGQKKEIWYHVYKLTEQQETMWKKWAQDRLKGDLLEQKNMQYAEFRYGFVRKYKKEEGLF